MNMWSSPGTRALRRRFARAVAGVTLAVAAVPVVLAAGAEPAGAATLTVCKHGCQFSQIAPAVAAAKSGDTIRVGPGTYQGGIRIGVSLRLAGSGPRATIIRGGGPVLTIGVFGARTEPAVSISGVTITGGLARSSPESVPFTGKPGVWAAGGGIEIPPAAHLSTGATVTISDSVITGNHADPRATVPSGITCPARYHFPKGQCPFAGAFGGGIDSWGQLTLTHSAVTGNTAGAAPGQPEIASDADGAGIFTPQGSLTLARTIVAGNRAVVARPDGRFAQGGGIFAGNPNFLSANSVALTVTHSVIAGNTAILTTDFPSFSGGKLLVLSANGGGLAADSGVTGTTIASTPVTGNSVIAKGLHGEPTGFDAGLNISSGPLTMTHSVIAGNKAITQAATSANAGPSGSALEVDGGGMISDTLITGNYASVVSPHGAAEVNGALGLFGNTSLLTIRDSAISGNTAAAASATGSASMQGAGVFNDGLLKLVDDRISHNTGTATGPSGQAQGGGIWNGTTFTGPPVRLTLQHTTVTYNTLTGSTPVTLQGGGIYTTPPATINIQHSPIAHNIPDQCFGCQTTADQTLMTRPIVPRSRNGP
jgi:hypothetical protein